MSSYIMLTKRNKWEELGLIEEEITTAKKLNIWPGAEGTSEDDVEQKIQEERFLFEIMTFKWILKFK